MIPSIKEKYHKSSALVKGAIYGAALLALTGMNLYIASETQKAIDQKNKEECQQQLVQKNNEDVPKSLDTLALETAWSEYANSLAETSEALGEMEYACINPNFAICEISLEKYAQVHVRSLENYLRLKNISEHGDLVDKAIWFFPEERY
jgi:hypothetical protein